MADVYRMLIVDDEQATREGVRRAVNWEALDVQIVGEASNGEQALELAAQTRPQIVICDIMMPRMDGIQLVNLLYRQNPDVQILFLSGYSDKDFLRNAIKLHVVDYLYKPLDLVELIQAVERCKEGYRRRMAQAGVREDDFALRLLGDEPLDSFSLAIDLSRPVCSIIIRLHPYSNATVPLSVFDAKVVSSHYLSAFYTMLEQIFGPNFLISTLDANLVVHANVREGEWKSPAMVRRMNALSGVIPECPVSVGVGRPGVGRAGIKESFRQARRAVESSFLVGYGRLIWSDEVSNTPYQPPENLRETVRGLLDPNGIAGAPAFVEALIDDMRSCDPAYIPRIRETLTDLSLAVFQYVQQTGAGDRTEGKPITDVVTSAPDIRMIRSVLIEALEKVYRETMLREQKGKIVYEAERYIQDNIMTTLTVKNIANSVYVTPNYLCYLYKQKTGRTLMQFILEVKMNKARKLLETDLSVGEIAEKLGYSSQSYFARRFCSQFHQTPTDYRSRNTLPGGKEYR